MPSGANAARPAPCGTGSASTMIVMMIAITPSVKLFSRLVFMARAPAAPFEEPKRRRGPEKDKSVCLVRIDACLGPDPFDQFVELDGLLGGGETVGWRKSVFAGGFSRLAGGSG